MSFSRRGQAFQYLSLRYPLQLQGMPLYRDAPLS